MAAVASNFTHTIQGLHEIFLTTSPHKLTYKNACRYAYGIKYQTCGMPAAQNLKMTRWATVG